MSATRVFVARLAGCGVFDPAGDRVGKVIDVLVSYRKSGAPKATGMLVEISGRRRVFVPIARVTSISAGQVITTGLIDLRRFTQRGQEVRVIAEILGRKVRLHDGSGTASIEDTGWDLFRLILETASGRNIPWSDRWGIANTLALFNPAPVT